MPKVSVLFVCLGNICRSPTAHAVFQALVDRHGLSSDIYVDGAGTGDWHLGHAPDTRSSAEAAKRGYDMSLLRSRLVTVEDFYQFDYVIAMDKSNLSNLQAICPVGFSGQLKLLMDFSTDPLFSSISEVPDPYYGGHDGFPLVLDMIEDAATSFLRHVMATEPMSLLQEQ